MPFPFQPWKIVLAALSEFVRNELEKVIEYLQLENQILREKLGGKRVSHRMSYWIEREPTIGSTRA